MPFLSILHNCSHIVDDYTILRFDVNYAIGCNNLMPLIYRDIVNITLQNIPTWHHRSITQICRDNIALTSSYCFAVSLITTTRRRSIKLIGRDNIAPSFNYENLSRKYRVNIELLFRHIAYHNNIALSLN
jgi:hypothetical protein